MILQCKEANVVFLQRYRQLNTTKDKFKLTGTTGAGKTKGVISLAGGYSRSETQGREVRNPGYNAPDTPESSGGCFSTGSVLMCNLNACPGVQSYHSAPEVILKPMSSKTRVTERTRFPWLPYVLPFGVFALLTYALPAAGFSAGFAYGIKTVVTAIALLVFWPRVRHEFRFEWSWLAVVAGFLVFGIWVGLEGYYPQLGSSEFDPFSLAPEGGAKQLMVLRMMGAVMVVPVVEELFWRSFAHRILISEDFLSVPLGKITLPSLLIVSVAFGLEHHRWLPGILAGLVYAGVLVRTRNLFGPTLAHAITNLALGVYVIRSEQWNFW